MDAASSVVSVSVTPVYNAADFVCALSQRRIKNTGAVNPGCAVERSRLPTLKRSFYDEMAASCRFLDSRVIALRLHRIRKPCTTAFVLSAMQVSLSAKVRARYGSAGATRDPGFQGDAAAWFVHGLQCRGSPNCPTVDKRVSPAHNSLTLSRSWIS